MLENAASGVFVPLAGRTSVLTIQMVQCTLSNTVTNVTIETVHQSGPQPSILALAVSVHRMFWSCVVWYGRLHSVHNTLHFVVSTIC